MKPVNLPRSPNFGEEIELSLLPLKNSCSGREFRPTLDNLKCLRGHVV
jgi:hypothetical protein